MNNKRTRAFKLPVELDSKVTKQARDLGYMNPSEYLRHIVRNELEKVEAQA